MIISRFAKQNFVDHSVADQASILRFIEDNWNLGRIGGSSFDALAGSLLDMFEFSGGVIAPPLFLDPATVSRSKSPTISNLPGAEDVSHNSRYTGVSKGILTAMKAGIHPAYEEVNVTCACGNTFRTRSTHKGDIRVEICSNCHPFFTGRQKLVDTEGRVDRFQKKIQKSKDLKETKAAAKSKKQPVAQ